MINPGHLFMLAWRILPLIPPFLVRGGFDLVARIIHLYRPGSVQQLERNLARISGLSGRKLRALSRVGLRRYMLYYAETFQMARVTPAQVAARTRTINTGVVRASVGDQRTVVAALGHVGNWDLAGAWAEQNLAHVVTVAEKLQPEELFQQFLQFREGLGMKIFAYEKGEGVFERLVAAAQNESALMPLLADRDLSSHGIVVNIAGEPMRVAPGPAVIARAAGVPFIGIVIRHERLFGARRRAAGSPWGIVLEFTDPIVAPADAEDPVEFMMQAWADHYSRFLEEHPEDWHMLQKCFLADLDLERLQNASPGTFG